MVIPATGTYTFRTTSDDGVRLLIDGVAVVDNWTEHSPADNDGAIALPAGAHTIEYRYYENGGGAVARLSWLIPGSAGYVVVPATALRTA